MPYAEKEREPNQKGELTVCLDGSEWVLEGVKNGKFHAVDRYCQRTRPRVTRRKTLRSFVSKNASERLKNKSYHSRKKTNCSTAN